MREIKFRAWDKIGERMYYPEEAKFCLTMIGEVTDDGELDNPYVSYRITAMQFTGLLDKNGKEIYEDDFILLKNIKYSVDWIGSGFWFVDCWEGSKDVEPNKNQEQDIEIIGNRFKNPELSTNQPIA